MKLILREQTLTDVRLRTDIGNLMAMNGVFSIVVQVSTSSVLHSQLC